MSYIGTKIVEALLAEGTIQENDERYDAIVNETDPVKMFLSVMPDKVLVYDGECIDTADDYSSLIKAYLNLTDEDVSYDFEYSGKPGETQIVNITLQAGSHKEALSFAQESDYVSEVFLDCISRFAEKYLSGRYRMLFSGGQGVHVLYLPQTLAERIDAIYHQQQYLQEIIVNNDLDQYYELLDSTGSENVYNLVQELNRDDPFFVSRLLQTHADESLVREFTDRFLTAEQVAYIATII